MSVEDCQINTSRIGNLQNEAPGRRLVTTWPGRRLPTHTNTRGNLRSPPRAHRLQRLGREPGVEALVGPDRAVVRAEPPPTTIRPRPCVRAPQSPIGPYAPRPAEPLVPPSGNCHRNVQVRGTPEAPQPPSELHVLHERQIRESPLVGQRGPAKKLGLIAVRMSTERSPAVPPLERPKECPVLPVEPMPQTSPGATGMHGQVAVHGLQGGRVKEHVGVSGQDHIGVAIRYACRDLSPATPTRNDANVRPKPPGNIRCAIDRPALDNKHMFGRPALIAERLECGRKRSRLIAGGNDDGDRHGVPQCRSRYARQSAAVSMSARVGSSTYSHPRSCARAS